MKATVVHVMLLDPDSMGYDCQECGRKREMRKDRPGHYITTVQGNTAVRHVYGGVKGMPDLGGLDLDARTGRKDER